MTKQIVGIIQGFVQKQHKAILDDNYLGLKMNYKDQNITDKIELYNQMLRKYIKKVNLGMGHIK